MPASMEELEKMAPTVSIETVVVVRPLKVVAVLCGIIGILLHILSIGATAWIMANGMREGLWEICKTIAPDQIDCMKNEERMWLYACRALCILSFVACFLGCFVICHGLRALNFRKRYRCYFVGMLIYFLGVLFEATALIIFPVKYVEELEEKEVTSWEFGWAYGIGWGTVVCLLGGALLICLDKDTDEVEFREKTSYNNTAIEELSS